MTTSKPSWSDIKSKDLQLWLYNCLWLSRISEIRGNANDIVLNRSNACLPTIHQSIQRPDNIFIILKIGVCFKLHNMSKVSEELNNWHSQYNLNMPALFSRYYIFKPSYILCVCEVYVILCLVKRVMFF